jgi:hypothetical protein
MRSTAQNLQDMAGYISRYGLHTGDQLAAFDPAAPMDICAVAYIVAERCGPPAEFYTNEDASLAIISASAPAMAAIRAISDALDSEACETEIEPGTRVPDYIEHVSNWAATASPVEPKRPPTVDEVIGRILRAVQAVDQRTAHQTSAA